MHKLVKRFNGLYISDQVQTGFARLGKKFWGFKDKGIKPDFIFSELIMDTKFSVTFDRNNIINSTVSKQMEKYYDYFKLKVVILTFNQKERLLKTQNKQYEIELINISSFSKFMSSYFKIKINNQELKEVFENINNVPFWKTT